ncbi:MAG: hypothetical protein ACFB00_08470 [Parvularculaceae bacterium]
MSELASPSFYVNAVTLVATVFIAIATSRLAARANLLSGRAVRLEADKLFIEWGEKALNRLAAATALRLVGEGDIDARDFKAERHRLRAELFALIGQGELFLLPADHDGEKPPALAALEEAANLLSGASFRPPTEGDYETVRRAQVKQIREIMRRFTADLQARVGDAWRAGAA